MRSLSFALCVFLTISLAACAASGPRYSEMSINAGYPELARVYFVREPSILFIARSAPVHYHISAQGFAIVKEFHRESAPSSRFTMIGIIEVEIQMTSLGNGSFFYSDLQPGTYRFRIWNWDAGESYLDLECKASQTYYVAVIPGYGPPSGLFRMMQVDEKVAQEKLQNLRYAGPGSSSKTGLRFLAQAVPIPNP